MRRFDPYRIMRAQRSASQEDLKKLYKRLTKRYHPDMWMGFPKDTGKLKEKHFKLIQDAYDLLTDPHQKQMYDEQGYSRYDEESRIYLSAVKNLQVMFLQALDQIPLEKMDYVNIVDQMRARLNDAIDKAEEAVEELKTFDDGKDKILKILKKRLKSKNKKNNILLAAVEARVSNAPAQIAQLELMARTTKKMLEVLADYEYNYMREPQNNGLGITTIMVRM